MALQILSKEMIKPSIPTPHYHKNFKFSFLDQIMPPSYMPLSLFYNTKFDLSNISKIHQQLKTSLSETLTIFYPLAGRIQNSVTVDCNDEGVLYTEAIAKFTLSEFLINPDISSLSKFLPLHANVPRDVKDVLLSAQVTVLGCGGVVIGVCMFHKISDITTVASFLKTWADIFKGKGKKEVKVYQDFTLGSSLLPPISSFSDDYESNLMTYFFHKANHSITRRFVFDVSSITTLRAKATSENVPNPTRYEALTGFISERLMAGLVSRSNNPIPTTLVISNAVNTRRRFDPPLPDTAFGNFIWMTPALYTPSGPKMEIHDYVETLREVLHGMNSKKIGELEPKIATQEIITSTSGEALKEFKFTSWRNQGFYDLDFGWGKPSWVAHMGDAFDEGGALQYIMFMEGKVVGEIELWLLLDVDDMAMLVDDQQFTEFATPNPGIPLDFD